MAYTEVHTAPTPGPEQPGWRNTVDGTQVGPVHRTKRAAVAAGRELARARRAEHVIHKADGTIGEKNSYGHDDPREPG